MKKGNIIFTWLLYAIIGVALVIVLLVKTHQVQKPLLEAHIPQETIDWFQNLIDGGNSDIWGILGPDDRDSTDWTRYEDIDDMLRLEDEYFVIYYSAKDSVVERQKALVSQRYAHEAIPKGERFMKNYPYPSQLNGRKLPVFLAKTVNDFRSICKQIGHGDPGTWAIGLYCFQFGVDGVYTDGIIISPEAWSLSDSNIDANSDDKELKTTLWHEMNHFMYFTNWDYTQTSKPSLWFTEGLAEYFAENYDRLNYMGNHKNYDLTNDFMDGNSEYWVGMSAYLCLEQQVGKNRVSDVVTNSYKTSIDNAIRTSIPDESLVLWNSQWHDFMEKGGYKDWQ